MNLTDQERQDLVLHGIEIKKPSKIMFFFAKLFGGDVCICGANKRWRGKLWVIRECQCVEHYEGDCNGGYIENKNV